MLFILTFPHQDILYQINYHHPPSALPISVHLPSLPSAKCILKQFIIRPEFSSIIVTHHPPSSEQSTFLIRLYIYWLFRHIHSSIPYIRLIIVTIHTQCLFCSFPFPPSPRIDPKKFIRRPKFSSIIVTHHPPSADKSTFFNQTIYLLFIL